MTREVEYVELNLEALKEERDRYLMLHKRLSCEIGAHLWLDSGECMACGFHRDGERVSA